MSRQGGNALVEFAIAWPVALLLVAGTIQLAVWGSEAFAAHQAALAGARAGSVAGGSAEVAEAAALAVLRPVLVGTSASGGCATGARTQSRVWVCVLSRSSAFEVVVGGSVPPLIPLVPGGSLPIGADVTLAREVFG